MDWDSDDLTPTEQAASEINAQMILLAYEFEYWLVQQGFSLRSENELHQDILRYISTMPEVKAVLATWTADPNYKFNIFMMEILGEIEG